MGRKHISKSSLPQLDSGMSNFGSMGERVNVSMEKTKNKTRPVQRDSGMSILDLENIVTQRAQRAQEDGIFTMRIRNIMGCFMGRCGNEPMSKIQNCPAQQDSKISILKIETENSLPQRHSKMFNLEFAAYCHSKYPKKAILTMQIKNIVRRFMGGQVDDPMGQKQPRPVQRDSRMSIFKWMGRMVNVSMGKTKNKTRPVQRDSRMSILAKKKAPV